MVYAIVFAALLITTGTYFLLPKKVIKLKKLHGQAFAQSYIWEKINTEIDIFNKMHIIMPSRRGVALQYLDYLEKLSISPRWKTNTRDGIQKLLYLCAAAHLFRTSRDELVKRQLHKNCIYVFGVQNTRIFRNLMPSGQRAFTVRQPMFKILAGATYAKTVTSASDTRFSNSYTVKNDNGVEIKNYVDLTLPVECFEINDKYRFTYNFGTDKMKQNISHTTDTFYCTHNGKVTALYIHGARANFENSLTEKTNDLNVYVNLKSAGKIFVIYTTSKHEAQNIIAIIKSHGNTLNYLQNSKQIERNRIAEELCAHAHMSRYVTGEKLKDRLRAACRYVPTLHLPTVLYDIADPLDLFDIIDKFDCFKNITRAHPQTNLNIVVMYSSQNNLIREYISAFTSRGDARTLIQRGIFLFFIDKIRAPNEAIYYFSKMIEAQTQTQPHTSDGIRNAQTIAFDNLQIVARKNVSYCVTNPRTGAFKYHKLPLNALVLDEFGNLIDRGKETITQKVFIQLPKRETKSTAVSTRKPQRAPAVLRAGIKQIKRKQQAK